MTTTSTEDVLLFLKTSTLLQVDAFVSDNEDEAKTWIQKRYDTKSVFVIQNISSEKRYVRMLKFPADVRKMTGLIQYQFSESDLFFYKGFAYVPTLTLKRSAAPWMRDELN